MIHLSQQLSGVNVVMIYLKPLLSTTDANIYTSAYVMLAQHYITALASAAAEVVSVHFLLVVSVLGIVVSLNLILLSDFVVIGIYLYIISYSIGLGPVTWIITGNMKPDKFQNSLNLIGFCINCLLGFITVLFWNISFTLYQKNMFFNFLVLIAIYQLFFAAYLILGGEESPQYTRKTDKCLK
ncbi:Facilitated trehalose transporter Tret1-1 [Cucumispora dikerogammari]|nr:Facilitated trehalose transporter Tret1-1 [Cucumispora dikerogammari]